MKQVQKRKTDRAKRDARAHPPPDSLLKSVWPPMLAKISSPSSIRAEDYHLEVKYDGYRGVVGLSGGQLAFITRNGLDLTSRFPSIAQALARLRVPEGVIDGEVVGFDSRGISRFQQLMTPNAALGFMAFDLLWLDGEDLREKPIEERRDLLESVLAGAQPPIALAERFTSEVDRASG
jgi:bifunctional non-homologous end joining protein LigD